MLVLLPVSLGDRAQLGLPDVHGDRMLALVEEVSSLESDGVYG